MARERIADYILFERTGSTPLGDRFRAGELDGPGVARHILLHLFNGAAIDEEELWRLAADREELNEILGDPHLGTCLGVGRQGSTPYLAYSYEPGRPLSDLLSAIRAQRLPLSIEQSLHIIDRAAVGLTAAYNTTLASRPVLHGFLVPDLVQLSSEGEIRVLGLELAPGLRSQLATHPAFSPYIAPEVRHGQAPAPTDDVYSLGALLFHLLSGQAPPDDERRRSELVEEARLEAEGDRLPAVIANLLKNSLAPETNRIPDVMTWQQVAGKVILDGEYNPSAFNLSFLVHTLFRRELDDEIATLEREKRQQISEIARPMEDSPPDLKEKLQVPLGTLDVEPVVQPGVNSVSATGRVPDPVLEVESPSALHGLDSTQPVEPVTAPAEAKSPQPNRDRGQPVSVITRNPVPVIRMRLPFMAGFALSFLGACTVFAAYFLFSKASPASAIEQRSDPRPRVSTDFEAGSSERLTSLSEPFRPQSQAPSRAVPEPATANEDTFLSSDDTPEEIPEEELESLLAHRTEVLESSLRAEYEARLRELESQLKTVTAEPSTTPPPSPDPDRAATKRLVRRSEASTEPSIDENRKREEVPTTSTPVATVPVGIEESESALVRADGAGTRTVISAHRVTPSKMEDSADSSALAALASSTEDASKTSTPAPRTSTARIEIDPPRLASPPQPVYPAAAKKFRKSARVTIRVHVNEKGEVTKTALAGAEVGFGFDRAALEAARRSRWLPASRNGEPIDSWAQLTIDFRP